MKKNALNEKKFEKMCEKMACGDKCCGNSSSSGSGGALYGVGFLGAAYYYISTAPTFWAALIGLFKAMVWPAFLVFDILKFLGS